MTKDESLRVMLDIAVHQQSWRRFLTMPDGKSSVRIEKVDGPGWWMPKRSRMPGETPSNSVEKGIFHVGQENVA